MTPSPATTDAEPLTLEQRLANLRKAVCHFCQSDTPYDEPASRHLTLGPGVCEARRYESGEWEPRPRTESFEESVARIIREHRDSKIAAIKELRALHPSLDLIAARNIIYEAW